MARPEYYRRTRGDRLVVLRAIAAWQPVPGADAAERLGWSRERWWRALWVIRSWWDVSGKGLVLTPAGRAAADRVPAAAPPYNLSGPDPPPRMPPCASGSLSRASPPSPPASPPPPPGCGSR